MEEQWKQIEINNVKWNYEVSTTGKVRSWNYRKTGQTYEITQHLDKYGYLQVTLCQNGKRKSCRVHKLVAIAFIPNPHNKPTVNHINENKLDNRVENLEWATHSEQVHHGTYQERQKQMKEKCAKRVKCIETGQIFDSIRQASKKTGLDYGSIVKVCQGIRKSVGGLCFEYMAQQEQEEEFEEDDDFEEFEDDDE